MVQACMTSRYVVIGFVNGTSSAHWPGIDLHNLEAFPLLHIRRLVFAQLPGDVRSS
jgi:hypothetical protein